MYEAKALTPFQMTAEENAGRLKAFTHGLLWDHKGNRACAYSLLQGEIPPKKQAV